MISNFLNFLIAKTNLEEYSIRFSSLNTQKHIWITFYKKYKHSKCKQTAKKRNQNYLKIVSRLVVNTISIL